MAPKRPVSSDTAVAPVKRRKNNAGEPVAPTRIMPARAAKTAAAAKTVLKAVVKKVTGKSKKKPAMPAAQEAREETTGEAEAPVAPETLATVPVEAAAVPTNTNTAKEAECAPEQKSSPSTDVPDAAQVQSQERATVGGICGKRGLGADAEETVAKRPCLEAAENAPPSNAESIKKPDAYVPSALPDPQPMSRPSAFFTPKRPSLLRQAVVNTGGASPAVFTPTRTYTESGIDEASTVSSFVGTPVQSEPVLAGDAPVLQEELILKDDIILPSSLKIPAVMLLPMRSVLLKNMILKAGTVIPKGTVMGEFAVYTPGLVQYSQVNTDKVFTPAAGMPTDNAVFAIYGTSVFHFKAGDFAGGASTPYAETTGTADGADFGTPVPDGSGAAFPSFEATPGTAYGQNLATPTSNGAVKPDDGDETNDFEGSMLGSADSSIISSINMSTPAFIARDEESHMFAFSPIDRQTPSKAPGRRESRPLASRNYHTAMRPDNSETAEGNSVDETDTNANHTFEENRQADAAGTNEPAERVDAHKPTKSGDSPSPKVSTAHPKLRTRPIPKSFLPEAVVSNSRSALTKVDLNVSSQHLFVVLTLTF
ncbi:hypothetical protein EJ06DRAFT_168328 [Trichodelitschia bisporula]|uniref:Uncharacterized protein n=1 Tax=Trichodelitschia bisporula TaxID=703511 RepID=A0A6G1HNB1_9PEZI|nr:hypothetical protein EJ06DRAFT_168328 [Trichodelitschia bisporula]